jgi:hypothetical protein
VKPGKAAAPRRSTIWVRGPLSASAPARAGVDDHAAARRDGLHARRFGISRMDRPVPDDEVRRRLRAGEGGGGEQGDCDEKRAKHAPA